MNTAYPFVPLFCFNQLRVETKIPFEGFWDKIVLEVFPRKFVLLWIKLELQKNKVIFYKSTELRLIYPDIFKLVASSLTASLST